MRGKLLSVDLGCTVGIVMVFAGVIIVLILLNSTEAFIAWKYR